MESHLGAGQKESLSRSPRPPGPAFTPHSSKVMSGMRLGRTRSGWAGGTGVGAVSLGALGWPCLQGLPSLLSVFYQSSGSEPSTELKSTHFPSSDLFSLHLQAVLADKGASALGQKKQQVLLLGKCLPTSVSQPLSLLTLKTNERTNDNLVYLPKNATVLWSSLYFLPGEARWKELRLHKASVPEGKETQTAKRPNVTAATPLWHFLCADDHLALAAGSHSQR